MIVTIIGLGLIGGSLALALKKYTHCHVVGYDACPRVVAAALTGGAIDAGADSPDQAVADADVVFWALAPSMIPQAVQQTAGRMKNGAIITDVASSKGDLNRLSGQLPPGVTYIGGHPMAGSEKNGFGAANADLFVGRPYILLPDSSADPAALPALAGLIAQLGARIVVMDMSDHDPAVADISHVPHIAAAALTMLAGDGVQGSRKLSLAAGGFRDMTRVASGNPAMWADICMTNRVAVVSSIRQLQHILERVNELLQTGDQGALKEFFAQAKDIRDASVSQNDKGGSDNENPRTFPPPPGHDDRPRG